MIKSIFSALFSVLPLSIAVFAQSLATSPHPTTFHVQGTISVLGPISAPSDSVIHGIPGALVQFHSEEGSHEVIADRSGFYQAILPFGIYTMSAFLPEHPALREYRRPAFRVATATTISLDGTLYLARTNCDIKIYKPSESNYHPTPEESTEAVRDSCGGEDFLAMPSESGVPFQLYVRYEKRSHADKGWIFNSGIVAVNYEVPVVVEYNLSTLLAKQVIYDAQNGTLEASGNVALKSASGETQIADAMTLKIENAKIIWLQK